MLTRLFTPLFTALLVVFLLAMALTGRGIDVDRGVLISFDVLLALVLGMVIYSVAARDRASPRGVFDLMQLLLVVAALLVDLLVLGAIVGRLSDFGATPNRIAALGENLVLLANLAWTAWLYLGFWRGTATVRGPGALADRLRPRLRRMDRGGGGRLPAHLQLRLSPRGAPVVATGGGGVWRCRSGRPARRRRRRGAGRRPPGRPGS